MSSDNKSTALTVDAAAEALQGMLSRQEKEQTRAAKQASKPEPEAAEDNAVVEGDEVETTEESEQPEQPDETDESEEQAEETDDEPIEPPKKFRVKVGGEEQEVTEDELVNGYSRTADYTRKTQALSEKAKAFEAEQTAVRAERAKYATYLTQLSEALQSMTPAEPDWDKLQKETPDQFAPTWAAWQQHEKRVQAVEAEKRKAQEAVANDQVTQMQGHLASEQAKLLEALPAWKDEKVATKEKADLVSYAKGLGYSDAEISQVVDHRVLLMLRNAMLHDRAQKSTPVIRKKIETVKVATPGPAASSKKPVSETTRAKQRLAKTGRVDDAAAAILTMLD